MKYKLSLLCIIKNEDYLEEFIIYHRMLGVEHFYIYDNESSFPVSERLNHYYYLCTAIDDSAIFLLFLILMIVECLLVFLTNTSQISEVYLT